MSASIPILIPPASFELVRDRIALILAEEFTNQSVLDGNNPHIKPGVWLERVTPFDDTELPAVNVMISKGDFDGHTQSQTDGTYTFNIDFHTLAKATTSEDGDKRSMLRLQRLIGMGRAILENPRYKTLAFPAPFVMWRRCSGFQISDPVGDDTKSVVMGRLVITVKVPENTELIQPSLLAGYDTKVKLYLTEKGYLWTVNAPSGSQSFDYTLDFHLS